MKTIAIIILAIISILIIFVVGKIVAGLFYYEYQKPVEQYIEVKSQIEYQACLEKCKAEYFLRNPALKELLEKETTEEYKNCIVGCEEKYAK